MNKKITKGAHHIGLTVPDLAATQAFFEDVLGFDKLGEVPDYPAVFLGDGVTMITLWQAANPVTATPFDRRNVIGLHHFALKVEDDRALEDVYQKVQNADGVTVEFSPEPLMGGPTRHMMCYIPGGIRMEFIALAA